MDVRPYVTAGVAIASAGALIAAMPAVISPLVTNDVKIAAADPKTSSRDVALAATLEEFIDAFFEGGFTDVTQLWLTENNADPNQDEFINAFFDGFADADYEYPGGFSEVVRRWLLWNTADPNQIAAIKQLFGGGFSEVAQQFLLGQTADPAQEVLINGFFDGFSGPASGDYEIPGGFTYLAWRQLVDNTADPNQKAMINQLFGGGFSEVAQQFLVGQTADPAQEVLINGFFDGFSGPESGGYEIPGGFTYLAWRQMVDNNVDPATETGINGFFGGGASEFTRLFLEAATPPSVNRDMINIFFRGYPAAVPDDPNTPDVDESEAAGQAGFVGLAHFIIDRLMGVPSPGPFLAPEEPESNLMLAAADVPEADLPEANEPITPTARAVVVDTEPAVVDDSAPAVEPVSAPVPAPAPAPVPAPAPAQPAAEPASSTEDGGAKDVTEDIKGGNKVEVDPILLETGGAKGPWDPGKAWGDFINKFTGGGAAPAATTPDTGDGEAGGEGEGAS